MMQDIYYTPKRQNKRPVILISILTGICILCVIFMMLGIKGQIIFQIGFLAAAAVEIFIFSRYMTVSYTYTVSYENNLFLVTQKVGKRIHTLCRLDLSALYRVRLYEEDDAVEDKHKNRYNYCVSFRPAVSYLAFFDDGEHIAAIRMELDQAFYEVLSRVVEANASRRATEDDEDNEEEQAIE